MKKSKQRVGNGAALESKQESAADLKLKAEFAEMKAEMERGRTRS